MENNENMLLPCPECGKMSDSIKKYRLPYKWIYLGIVLIHQDVTYTCCPECMRKKILLRGFTYHILTTHVMWPLIILPWSIIQLIRSYQKGHSKEVLELMSRSESPATPQ